jgi:RbsD / FucU transport protein family
MQMRRLFACIVIVASAFSAQAQSAWQEKVKEELPLMGHRNWIVIVDSAYPLQSNPGVETIDTEQDQLVVLEHVLEAIKASRHVRPLVHTDAELQYVPENEAPGVSQYRQALKSRLAGVPVDSIPHQVLIDRLNTLGKTFHVLILKSTMTIPYTSVFVQLDCKYWSAASEASLRSRMNGKTPPTKSGP